ncbi:type I-G CRISPR-associated protein Csb2 [Actinophytocola gossypii]|uniref:Type I-U CRISPR-associated protein Cas5/Cas6 n=1 Tax=Actinophytocola gossypii TaxID=2812003 RepID=A0ABT2JI60_9PSEU|nr:type I-U CRISPR-associated protein Csb2 [Actinophytocola gossypii]MCT2587564.1 type I-U CRISPR-associated protein Cas5/Cas6 [Actinophytocola gossypii]
MPFSVVARLPLGTYRGHRADGSPDQVPSVARLYSALLCAAGFGPRAVPGDDGWEPCDEDVVALRWLEDNPPDEVSVPALRASRRDAVAYRQDGTIRGSRGARTLRRLPKQEAVTAVGGPFVWTWREHPPELVVEALRALCPDVPHLGAAESPVVLTVSEDDVVSTHRRAADAGVFDHAPGMSVDVPVGGRLMELRAAHRAERTGAVGSDRAGTDERSRSVAPPRGAVRPARYRDLAVPAAEVPWSEVLVLPLETAVPARDRVRWAVAAHRALIRVLDQDAPPVLTGVYPAGARRPPNRVALHLLDASMPVDLPGGGRSALAVLIPRGVSEAERDAVYRAVGAIRALRRGQVVLPVVGGPEVRAGDRFWREPGVGRVRLWRPDPAAVPDTRGWKGWTFLHAALLSVGFVWQGTGIARSSGRGAQRDEAIVEAVNAAGVAVVDVAAVRSSRPSDFVHHFNEHAVVRPYTATLTLGDLGTLTTVLAIGQSRHLGGGLLVPADHDEGTVLG